MIKDLARRDFLKASAAFAGAAAANAFSCVEIASAAPIEVPTVDKLSIRVLVDSSYDLFLRPKQANGVSIVPRGARRRFPQDAAQRVGPVALAGIAGGRQCSAR